MRDHSEQCGQLSAEEPAAPRKSWPACSAPSQWSSDEMRDARRVASERLERARPQAHSRTRTSAVRPACADLHASVRGGSADLRASEPRDMPSNVSPCTGSRARARSAIRRRRVERPLAWTASRGRLRLGDTRQRRQTGLLGYGRLDSLAKLQIGSSGEPGTRLSPAECPLLAAYSPCRVDRALVALRLALADWTRSTLPKLSVRHGDHGR